MVENCLIEANDRSGVMMEFLDKGSNRIMVQNNRIQYNNGFGVESYATKNGTVKSNVYEGNGLAGQEKISAERRVIME